jgi:alpha-D-xyloside xylohydrolase
VMRALTLEFPGDPGCDTLDRQYMLGDNLLVAPVFTEDGWVDYYLPAGRWTHFLTGQVVEGGGWVREQHDVLSLPLLVRPNCIIPEGLAGIIPDYDYADWVTFHVFELQDGADLSVDIPTLAGEVALTLKASRQGRRLEFKVSSDGKPWQVLLRGVAQVNALMGGEARSDPLGLMVSVTPGTGKVIVEL